MDENGPRIVALTIGNTRSRFGLFTGPTLEHQQSMTNDDVGALAQAVGELRRLEVPVVIGSVNDPVADAVSGRLGELSDAPVYRIRRDIPIEINHALDDASTVGTDRLLCAVGAFSRCGQACIVIDAGTGVTVDFIDGEGTFQGGAIAPGIRMMLRALHEHTAALPEVTIESVPTEPFGKDTPGAMRLGVCEAVRGMVHVLITRYAEAYGGYPQVVATGGDAPLLFEHDELVEHVVPDLQLLGVQAVCAKALADDDD